MKSLLLIDLSGIFWRCWHATKDLEVSTAHNDTLAKVHALRSDYDYVAVCCDSPPYDRKKLYPEYKANREAAPPLALDQFRRVKEQLANDGLLLWEAPGFEADDVIAWAADRADLEAQITIASSDKDMLQLVTDPDGGIVCLNPFDGARYDRAAVIAKFGVAPEQFADFLALVGDSSDNVPGVKGIGPKKAAELLMQFDNLEAIIAAGPSIQPEGLGKLVRDGAESARLSKKLVTLRTDVPLNFGDLFMERKAATPKPEPDGWGGELEPEPPQETALAKAQPVTGLVVARPVEWSMQLEPSRTVEAWKVAKAFHESRMFGKLGGAEAHFMAIMRGRALGLDAATSCASFHNVEGRLTLHAEIIIGLVMRSGKAEFFECTETSDTKATWVTKRVGARQEVSITWDMERALRAELVEMGPKGYRGISRSGRASNWDKYPRTMLRWRAGTELAHAIYPDVVTGLVAPDEVEE